MSNIVEQLYNERGVEIRQIFLENGLNLEPTRENIAKALLVHKAAVKQGKKYDEFIPLLMGAISGIASLAAGTPKTPEQKAAEQAEAIKKLAPVNTMLLAKWPDISKAPPEIQATLAKIKGNPQAFPTIVDNQINYSAAPTQSAAEKKLIESNVPGYQAPEPGESGQAAQGDGAGTTEGNFFTRNSKKILIGFGVFVVIATVVFILKKKN